MKSKARSRIAGPCDAFQRPEETSMNSRVTGTARGLFASREARDDPWELLVAGPTPLRAEAGGFRAGTPTAVPPATPAPRSNNSPKPATPAKPKSRRAPRQTRRRARLDRSDQRRDTSASAWAPRPGPPQRAAAKKRRLSRRSAPGPGPYLDGFTGPRSSDRKPNAPGRVLIAPRANVDDGLSAAVAVPATLTLAALTLVGTAVLRRRRLAARRGRD